MEPNRLRPGYVVVMSQRRRKRMLFFWMIVLLAPGAMLIALASQM